MQTVETQNLTSLQQRNFDEAYEFKLIPQFEFCLFFDEKSQSALDKLSFMGDNMIVKYEIITTNIFDKWLTGVRDLRHRARIINRFDHIQLGNFGDHKRLSEKLFELRFFFGPGFRIYYTINNDKVIFLLCGGDKSTQSKDIKKAKTIINELE